jgi:hypothetical protein
MDGDRVVAETILQQIGPWTLMSLGARDKMATARGVQFRVGRGNPHRKFLVDLNWKDLYDVRLVRVTRKRGSHGPECVVEEEMSDLYFDGLGEALIRALDRVSA